MARRSEGSPEKVRAAARWEKTKAKACRQLLNSVVVVPLLSLVDCRNTIWEGVERLLLLRNQRLLLIGQVFAVVVLVLIVAPRRGSADEGLSAGRRAHVGSFAKLNNTKIASSVLLAVMVLIEED